MTQTRTSTRRARAIALALLTAGALTLAACSDDSDDTNGGASDTTAASTPSGDADVAIRTFQFEIPDSLPAGTLTVTNADATTHTFTEGAVGNDSPAFDVSIDGPDGSATIDVEPGTYEVHCNIHTSMTGTLVVV
jgi:plastocyanin